MRIALHTGKGGVGKTTISTVTAIAAARSGHRTLLLSTDPAHSVADVLDVPVGADPVRVVGVDGLWAAQVDVRGRFEQAWSSVREYLVGVLAAHGVAAVQAEELTVLPGADEIIGLLELQRQATTGDFDVIVVDCAPTGETLRLLALPETIAFYADKVMGTPARWMRSLAAGLAGFTGRAGSPGLPDGEVRDALAELLDRLRSARALLIDPEIAGIRLVMTPERVVIAEARRLWTALSLHGFSVQGVVVNRLLPAGLDGGVFEAWIEAQQQALRTVTESFHGIDVLELASAPQEPIGVVLLARLADQLFGDTDPMARQAIPAGISTEQTPAGFLLRIPLPLATRGEVDLSRTGDDLVVTIGPHRRRLALPSLLRRCTTVGARFEQDELVVEFVPDPAAWPASLRTGMPGEPTVPGHFGAAERLAAASDAVGRR